MIDMKQIKENVSNKIKSYQEPESPEVPVRETRHQHQQRKTNTMAMAIGASIRIKGDVSGDEDLIIQGNVEGTVELKGHSVTISKSGKVKANIDASQIIVEGELTGDMHGEEKVVIRETGNVHGNIVSPRVTLEDGALFKGSIEMDPQARSKPGQKPAMASVQNRDNKELQSA